MHVRETYALDRGVTAEDFAVFVDLVPEGPAQVSGYRELGYAHIRRRRPG